MLITWLCKRKLKSQTKKNFTKTNILKSSSTWTFIQIKQFIFHTHVKATA